MKKTPWAANGSTPPPAAEKAGPEFIGSLDTPEHAAEVIEKLVTGPGTINQALGRLLATDAISGIQAWMQSEQERGLDGLTLAICAMELGLNLYASTVVATFVKEADEPLIDFWCQKSAELLPAYMANIRKGVEKGVTRVEKGPKTPETQNG